MNTYYVGSIPISDELYHHGIKGQKWGIRRFQNEDGSYTKAGKERKRYTTKYLTNQISKNERKVSLLRETPLNRFQKIENKNQIMIDRIKTENKKNEEALERYAQMSNNEKKRMDAIIRLRNIGNASFKRYNSLLTQKYVDTKLYNEKYNNSKYIKGYVQAALGYTIPIAMLVAGPRIISKLMSKSF